MTDQISISCDLQGWRQPIGKQLDVQDATVCEALLLKSWFTLQRAALLSVVIYVVQKIPFPRLQSPTDSSQSSSSPKMSSFLARRAATAPQFARTFSSTPARHLAKISIIGSLGNTPEVQATSTGRELLKFSIASTHRSKGETKTSWFRVTSFAVEGARREFYQSLPKGYVTFYVLLPSLLFRPRLRLTFSSHPGVCAELWFTSRVT